MAVIPAVFLRDLGWLLLLLVANWRLHLTGWPRRLLQLMAVYVTIEMLFHRFMEDAVATLM
jgi:hypothetical protein